MFIILYGPEVFLAERKLKEIIDSYRKSQKSGLSFYSFDAEALDLDDFKNAAQTESMFAEKKLIILKNLFLENEKLAKKIMDFSNDYGIQDMKETVIVFLEKGNPKSKNFDDLLEKPNLFQEFKKLEGVKLTAWAKAEFEKAGAKIEPPALMYLISAAGSDLYRLKNEIDKLTAYKKSITKKDVEELVVSDFHSDIFAVIDAIAKKDKKSSLKILNDHLEQGESEQYLLSMIVYQFRNLIKVKSLADKELKADQIAKKTGLHPFVVKKTLVSSRLFSFDDLKEIYKKLFDIDLKIKTGEIEPQTALNLFVAEL